MRFPLPLFLLLLLASWVHCDETSWSQPMTRGSMRSRLHNLKQSHAEALRVQHDALASQVIPAPEGYVVQAYLPSDLILQSDKFSPSLAFPQGTSFAMVMRDHRRSGSIRSLSSSWSIILDTVPLCAETLPSFMEKGMISTVPSGMSLYLFEGSSFTGQCRRVQVPPKESFLIGSLVMVPVSSHHIATFFTQENYSGCEINVGEWTNNTTPRIGGIRSMHLYRPLVLTSYNGVQRLFMAGDYPSVKMYGNVHMLSLPLDGDHGALLCQESECFSLLNGDSNMALTIPFHTYNIPEHMAVKVALPIGTIVLYGKGTLDRYLKERTVDASLAYMPKPGNLPSICSEHQCFSLNETPKMQLNVPITQLSVPEGWLVTMTFTLSSGEYEYGPGQHRIKCMLTCTIRTITVRRA